MWRETPKGYCLRHKGEAVVVFWDERRQSWRFVHESEFSGTFPSLSTALDAAEDLFGVREIADRTYCRDVPPKYRHLRDADVPKPPPVDPAVEARRNARTQFSSAVRGIHDQIRASLRRPAWATTLQLQGSGPWTLQQAREAYRALAKQHHPDRNGDPAVMAQINDAWESAQRALST